MDLYGGGSSGPKERMESGGYAAWCIGIIDLGTHENTHPKAKPGSLKKELMLIFEFPSKKMEDGRPFVLSQSYTASLGKKANLTAVINSWLATTLSEDDKRNFNIKDMLDKPALITVSKDKGRDGNFYNNIKGVTKLPEGMPIETRVNDLVYYEINDSVGDPEAHGKVYEWIQRKYIVESQEGKELGLKVIEREKEEDETPSDLNDEEIPF